MVASRQFMANQDATWVLGRRFELKRRRVPPHEEDKQNGETAYGGMWRTSRIP